MDERGGGGGAIKERRKNAGRGDQHIGKDFYSDLGPVKARISLECSMGEMVLLPKMGILDPVVKGCHNCKRVARGLSLYTFYNNNPQILLQRYCTVH